MQYCQLAAILTLIAMTFATVVHAGAKYGFTVGQRQIGDEKIEVREEEGRGPPDYILSYSKTYVGNNYHVITQVVVENEADGGAHAAIVAGGPDHTYITLAYAIPRYGQMNYKITIYGKIPAFRKIP